MLVYYWSNSSSQRYQLVNRKSKAKNMLSDMSTSIQMPLDILQRAVHYYTQQLFTKALNEHAILCLQTLMLINYKVLTCAKLNYSAIRDSSTSYPSHCLCLFILSLAMSLNQPLLTYRQCKMIYSCLRPFNLDKTYNIYLLHC